MKTQTDKSWGRLGGSYQPAQVRDFGAGGLFRVTRIKADGSLWSLARYVEAERYWQFLGEYETRDLAKERAGLIAAMNERANRAPQEALSRAVNRAIANGVEIVTEVKA